MSTDEITLQCQSLWKVYGDEALRQVSGKLSIAQQSADELADEINDAGGIVACGDVSVEIKRGEFFVLMGLSGSGKSTLMRCMSRLTEPTSGKLLLDGDDFLAASKSQLRNIRRTKMGMVFQHFGLFPHMSVLENVAYPLRVQKMSVADRTAKATEMIKLVGLEGREAAYPDQLSGGQKQRVGIARSLAVDPELWFLDEPFSALDPLIRWQMQSELLRLQTLFKKTIVFVTHDFMEAVRLADRIAIMKDGRVVQIGTPEDIVLAPANDYVAEFVKEVPRTRIIKVSQLMEPVAENAAQSESHQPASSSANAGVTPDMTLEEALSWSAGRGQTMSVKDSAGNTVGVITPDKLASVLNSNNLGGSTNANTGDQNSSDVSNADASGDDASNTRTQSL